MKPIFHIVLLLLCPLFSWAQHYIRGVVRDGEGRPLQNVTIVLQRTGYVYRSGSEGAFGIVSGQQKDTLLISHNGYVSRRILADAASFNEVKLEKAPLSKQAYANKLASLTQDLRREAQQQWFVGDETYASIIENQFIPASGYPTTGLTLNVDRASYSNIRRFISMGSTVPPDAVRIEEMLNYFNFDYREPAPGQYFELHTTFTDCPWNKSSRLLFAQVVSRKLRFDSLPPSHLVFLIDVSGSMDMPNRLPLLKSSFRALVHTLRPVDSVSIVAYGGTVGVMLNTTSGAEKEKIFRVIDSLQPGGSTPGESGIKLAYSVARNHFIKGGNNRIILATDGDFNVGLRSDEDLEEMILNNRRSGIYLTCLGIGMGNYKDSKIQMLAQRGNGNFAYLDSYTEAEKVLLKEFTQTLYTVADDAYLNVSFDPAYVKEYRLIGFGNKVGAIKDTNAKVEGGSIGSAYSMIVAFELLPTDKLVAAAAKGDSLAMVRYMLDYTPQGKAKPEQLQLKPLLSYKAIDAVDSCYRFASAVIMFGGLLRESRFYKEVSWNDVLRLATASADQNNFTQKEFISLVESAKALYSRKRKRKEGL